MNILNYNYTVKHMSNFTFLTVEKHGSEIVTPIDNKIFDKHCLINTIKKAIPSLESYINRNDLINDKL